MAKKKLPNLGPAEWEILRIIWEAGEASARTVAEKLREQRPVAQTTVTTLLTRLLEKGLVRRRPADRGKAFVYEAALEPSSVRTTALSRVVRQLFGDDLVSAFSALVDEHDLSPEEIRRLRAVVNKAAKEAQKTEEDGKP